MMKILMLAPLPPPSGGIASWTIRYKEYCDNNHIPLRIVNIAMKGNRATNEVMKRSIKEEFNRTQGIIKDLKKQIKDEIPDVVHINTSCSPFGVIRDALCAFSVHNKSPIILHCRCNIEDQLGKRRISRIAFKYLVKKSQKVIVLNKYSRQFIDNIEEKKAVFIPNIANSEMIDESHIINDTIKKVIYVGHIERAKGIIQIIEAARKLSHINFILVGAVREDISNLDLPSNVSIIGRVSSEKVRDYLKQADVFVFPSITEGFSNAVLEAMAMGLPIIASDVGANSEMIEDKGGMVLPENTGKNIIDALVLLESPGIRKKMSIWNVEKVKRAYMIDEVMKQYFDLYTIVNKKGSKV